MYLCGIRRDRSGSYPVLTPDGCLERLGSALSGGTPDLVG
jgi:hypothetical protein